MQGGSANAPGGARVTALVYRYSLGAAMGMASAGFVGVSGGGGDEPSDDGYACQVSRDRNIDLL